MITKGQHDQTFLFITIYKIHSIILIKKKQSDNLWVALKAT